MSLLLLDLVATVPGSVFVWPAVRFMLKTKERKRKRERDLIKMKPHQYRLTFGAVLKALIVGQYLIWLKAHPAKTVASLLDHLQRAADERDR